MVHPVTTSEILLATLINEVKALRAELAARASAPQHNVSLREPATDTVENSTVTTGKRRK